MYKRNCNSCENQIICMYEGTESEDSENCPDWRMALALYEQLPEEAIDHFPEYEEEQTREEQIQEEVRLLEILNRTIQDQEMA